MSVYSTMTPAVNTQALPTAITTFDVRRLLASTPDAVVEVGPSVTHPNNWNRLRLPDGHSYIVYGAAPTWSLECSCVTDEQSCPACRAAARKASRRTIHNA